MWKFDLSDINDMQSTFDRLNEKKAMLQKARPLPKIALQKSRKVYLWNGPTIPIVLKEIH